MSLIAGVNYDPSTAVAKSTASLLAMTAFDTTNLRLTFTAPANGSVLVRIRCVISGATTMPQILLGVMSGATVVARQAPLGSVGGTAVATTGVTQEAVFTVTGLSGSQTWDAAYAVQVLKASTNIHYGGPNDSTTNNAWGSLAFEVYDAPNLLASKNYDPSTAGSKSTASNLAMTAVDTTNLRVTFTAPASGNVMVHMRCAVAGATTYPQVMFGVLSGATVECRADPVASLTATAVATSLLVQDGVMIVKGLSGSQTWDAAYDVETPIASTLIQYGGPNNTTGANAYGGFLFEVWSI